MFYKTIKLFKKSGINVGNIKKYDELTYMDLLNKNLQVMDSTATSMCMDNKIQLRVFNMNETGNIIKAATGADIGTVIK